MRTPVRTSAASTQTLWAATSMLFLACSRPAPATPAEAYSHFLHHVAAVRSGEEAPLMEDFDAATRQALTEHAASMSKAADGRLPVDPTVQLLQGPPPVAPTALTVVEQTADRATLEVQVDAGASGRVLMVREEGRWRVHLELPSAK